jgi:hypothetical protein
MKSIDFSSLFSVLQREILSPVAMALPELGIEQLPPLGSTFQHRTDALPCVSHLRTHRFQLFSVFFSTVAIDGSQGTA